MLNVPYMIFSQRQIALNAPVCFENEFIQQSLVTSIANTLSLQVVCRYHTNGSNCQTRFRIKENNTKPRAWKYDG